MAVSSPASLLYFGPHHAFSLCGGFAYHTDTSLVLVFPFPALAFSLCPHSSVYMRYRNFNLLSIDYVFRPRLRPRLTQGRSALPWKPWIFGRKDSHLSLATHSGILSTQYSTTPYRYRFVALTMLLYRSYLIRSHGFGGVFSPGHFRRSTSRLVSCYALF